MSWPIILPPVPMIFSYSRQALQIREAPDSLWRGC